MQRSKVIIKWLLFFTLGIVLTSFVLGAILYLVFSYSFRQKVYPGVKIANFSVGGQTISQIKNRFPQPTFQNMIVIIDSSEATLSAQASDFGLRLDAQLMANRAYSIGRQTPNPYYNFLQIISARENQINLPLEVSLDHRQLSQKLDVLAPQIEKKPVNAAFQFQPQAGPDQKGRVEAFSPSENGLAIDREKIAQEIISQTKKIILSNWAGQQVTQSPALKIPLYTKILSPDVQTSTADQLGIKNLLGEGVSYFYDSIPNRVYNINLGTQKVSGSLIAPDEIFSFDQSIGTVSAIFGFQKAYSIIQGKTVLDDGGGVCQVSTTLYRAVLKAGLPVIERAAHAYRVGFYEEGGFLPGMDATVYPPSPDFRFKNDTGNWLLLQANFDPSHSRLTFDIFGTADGRKTQITGPVILSTSPPPDPITEDDPTKPVGTTTQVDTAHFGANVYFKRKVTRGSEVLIDETVTSNYIPWPARFLRGTKT